MPDRRDVLKQLGGAAAATLAWSRFAHAAGDAPRRIKIGQIGVGHAHASKLAVFRQSDDYEVVGIVEPDDKLRIAPNRTRPFVVCRG